MKVVAMISGGLIHAASTRATAVRAALSLAKNQLDWVALIASSKGG